ncbi:ATP-binding protein [Lusitaniella coriacea]|nr:ATP-binding protein [Lusitaniella coriacea]
MAENLSAPKDQTNIVLEANQRLSQSLLWRLQRQFFEQQGLQAWNTGKVPHYITSNPFIANAYGKVVFGFLRDWSAISEGETCPIPLDLSQPVYILELGSGSGRFAYHFLKQFFADYPHSVLREIPVKYVMTDFARSTLDFWQSHPFLQPFIEQGLLDFARFDIESTDPLQLVQSGEVLSAETLKNPAIVFANYFFDSIPQDLFAIQKGQLHETLLTLSSSHAIEDLTESDSLEALEIHFEDRPINVEYYENPAFNRVLQYYQQHLDDTNLLFPSVALDCLAHLRKLTGDRLLLLAADKGYSREDFLQDREKPKLMFHQGCFSLMVNFHAIAQYTQLQGGQALVPSHLPRGLNICAFLFGEPATEYGETQQAYQNCIQKTSPDDFFALKKIVEPVYSTLNLRQILAYLRFSGWDSNIFLGCLPALMAQVETAPESLWQEVYRAIQNVWEMYYWIGEDADLPLQLARLLSVMGDDAEALDYLDDSLRLYGETSENLLHQAACYFRLGEKVDALATLERTLVLQPQLNAARILKQAIETDNDAVESVLQVALSQDRDLSFITHANTLDPLSLSLSGLKQVLERYIEGQPPTGTVLETEPIPLSQLGEKFQLSPFERAILLLCVGLEIEPNFQSLCAKAQGDAQKPYATLGLALSALPGADWSVLSPQNALHYWQLVRMEPGRLLTESPLKIDRGILCYLLGEPSLAPQLADLVTIVSPQGIALPPSHRAIAQQIVTAWSASPPHQRLPLIALNGTDETTNANIATIACDFLGFQLVTLSAAVLPASPHDLKELQRCWEREAILTHSVLLLDREMATDPAQEGAIALFLETLNTPVIFSSRDRKPPLRRSILIFDVPKLPHEEQIALWNAYLQNSAEKLGHYGSVLATQFSLTPTAIQTVCLQVNEREDDATFREHLWHLCRLQARPNLDDLAQRIEATATWNELVLPDRERQILKDMAAHLKYRAQVYQDWGFAKKGDRGLGISALFYGESGTGKTMAAEVLAADCNLDLYRIDLSTVVSKYIGETEKNLRRIFDAAETGGVILLFDEADALFGKRTEIKDSRDRHANIEVSYLLQRMETYQGLAILTSNLKDSLDKAFLRRLRFMLPFPFPDSDARSAIWQGIFPTQTPTQGLDYTKLGQLKVAGGNIRNIALNAAFLAAQNNSPVTMEWIRQAAQREYLKLEKLLTNEEIRGWSGD